MPSFKQLIQATQEANVISFSLDKLDINNDKPAFAELCVMRDSFSHANSLKELILNIHVVTLEQNPNQLLSVRNWVPGSITIMEEKERKK